MPRVPFPCGKHPDHPIWCARAWSLGLPGIAFLSRAGWVILVSPARLARLMRSTLWQIR
jgi:hypothetical protein